jgi:ABC-2 type transport system permease protein
MNAMIALIRREFLEHRGAFLYAPVVLVSLVTLFLVAGMIFGHAPSFTAQHSFSSLALLQLAFGAIGAAWGVYLVIALYFYYSDAFSADGRNNSLLFWKSMPQSDLKILTSKALAGVTILPALILAFALITMLVAYLLSFPLSVKLPLIPVANPIDMLAALFGMGVAAAVFMLLSVLWYAPFLALVAGLSVLVKRWAIPAALLFLGALVVSEGILTYGHAGADHPIRDYIAYRAESFGEDLNPFPVITQGSYLAPFDLIFQMVANIDWLQTGIGVLFAILVVYLASEYRRRRIEG